MKKIIIIIAVLLFSHQHSIAQKNKTNGTAYYKKSLDLKIDNSSEAKGFFELIIKATNDAIFVLQFNKKQSSFELNIDEIPDSASSFLNKATIMGGGKGVYYIDTEKNILIHQEKAYGKEFLIASMLNAFKWELLNEEEKVIQNYHCYKAILKKKVLSGNNKIGEKVIEAWYAPDLLIPHGPIGYGNLPGLIVELIDGKAKYTLEKIAFDSSIEISKPNRGDKISEFAFDSLAVEAIKNRKREDR